MGFAQGGSQHRHYRRPIRLVPETVEKWVDDGIEIQQGVVQGEGEWTRTGPGAVEEEDSEGQPADDETDDEDEERQRRLELPIPSPPLVARRRQGIGRIPGHPLPHRQRQTGDRADVSSDDDEDLSVDDEQERNRRHHIQHEEHGVIPRVWNEEATPSDGSKGSLDPHR